MTGRFLCFCAVMAFGVNASAASSRWGQPQDVAALPESRPVERPLASRETHRYTFPMHVGEYVKVLVQQQRIDVVVQVRGAAGDILAEFQDEVGGTGQEQVEIVADNDGTYTLVVSPAPGTTQPGAYAIHAAIRRACTDADRAMQEARRLRTAAERLFERGRAAEAEPLVARALSLMGSAHGAGDEQVGAVLAQLAAVYVDLPDFERAESCFERALSILERTRGARSPVTAFVRSRLANMYQLMGQRPRAEVMLRQATAVIEETLGPEHIWYVRCLGTLSALRADAGDLPQAAEILRRELAILERIDYSGSLLYAGVLNNLGGVYGRQHDYARAETCLKQALALGELLHGPDDYFLSNPLINLGAVARARNDYRTAEDFYVRALSIRQRAAGEDGADLGLILNNLANVYHATGDYRRALDTHLRGLRIGERAFGPYHRNTLLSVGNIARVSAAMGDLQTAIAYERRADAIIEKQLAINLSVGSERQKQLFVQSIAERTDRTISLHLDRARGRADAASLAALVLLQRKGRVLDAMLDTFAVVRQRTTNPHDRDLLTQINRTTTRLAELALRSMEPAGREEPRQQAIRDLESRKERLEIELAERSADFRAQLRPVTLESVQAAIPEDAALIEFALFRSFDPLAERTKDAYGPAHYAAYVVRTAGPPQGFDLGDARAIDTEIASAQEELRDARHGDFDRRLRGLYALVMRPLALSYGDATRLLISPDGNLNLIPFEALADEQGRHLLERYRVTYLTSGRDLLRMRLKRAARNPAVVVADPLFGEPDAVPTPARYFAPLPGSAVEGRAIKSLFPRALLITGPRATKAALLQLHAPAILHVASHGFFVQSDAGSPRPEGGDAASADTRAADAPANADNPLLRSGLALAGANFGGRGREDGILTALEASGLNLWGTKLVTLSACDTGIGEVRNGEGVYGLRRAFALAGAESLVMSLWPVSDTIARETMVAYYHGLRAGLGRGDALRQAKLAMMRRHPHPFYWASFIQSGEWADLNGRR